MGYAFQQGTTSTRIFDMMMILDNGGIEFHDRGLTVEYVPE